MSNWFFCRRLKKIFLASNHKEDLKLSLRYPIRITISKRKVWESVD